MFEVIITDLRIKILKTKLMRGQHFILFGKKSEISAQWNGAEN